MVNINMRNREKTPHKSLRVSRRVKLRIFASYRNPSRPWLQNRIYTLTSTAHPLQVLTYQV